MSSAQMGVGRPAVAVAVSLVALAALQLPSVIVCYGGDDGNHAYRGWGQIVGAPGPLNGNGAGLLVLWLVALVPLALVSAADLGAALARRPRGAGLWTVRYGLAVAGSAAAAVVVAGHRSVLLGFPVVVGLLVVAAVAAPPAPVRSVRHAVLVALAGLAGIAELLVVRAAASTSVDYCSNGFGPVGDDQGASWTSSIVAAWWTATAFAWALGLALVGIGVVRLVRRRRRRP